MNREYLSLFHQQVKLLLRKSWSGPKVHATEGIPVRDSCLSGIFQSWKPCTIKVPVTLASVFKHFATNGSWHPWWVSRTRIRLIGANCDQRQRNLGNSNYRSFSKLSINSWKVRWTFKFCLLTLSSNWKQITHSSRVGETRSSCKWKW